MFPNVVIGILLYFLLAVSVAAWWFVPGARVTAQRLWAHAWSAAFGWCRRGQRAMVAAGGAARTRSVSGWGWWRQRGWLVLATLAVLTSVPVAMAWLRHMAPPDLYDHTRQRPGNARVAALLDGEQLVPPPALPPELFLRAEVQEARPLIGSANREWALLDAEFRQRLLVLFQLMREQHGYELVLLEGYRSADRQAALKALGPTVTLAGANESYHQYGLAADVAFVRDGRIVISERDPWAMRGYELYGALAADLGLTWGGQWASLKDFGHIELRRAGLPRAR